MDNDRHQSLRTFYSETIPPVGEELVLAPAESQHAVKVLRIQPGERIEIVDGRGKRSTARVHRFAGRSRAPDAVVSILSVSTDPGPRCEVTLVLAPPRAKQMAECVRIATEFGVARILPVICNYSVARPDAGSLRHWQAEAIAALKQSGNSFLPAICRPVDFQEALAHTPANAVFGDTSENNIEAPLDDGAVAVWVGPEGGFSTPEKAALLDARAKPVKLGRWTLRVETAVPALLGWLHGKGIGL